VQACARAEGSSSSNAALLSRPNDLRMVIEPFAHQRPAGSLGASSTRGVPLS
jgi:hypothetical protein